jgi:putative CocE/NonD family hydrolase
VGTIPWRLAMGGLALLLTLSTFVVAPLLPGSLGTASGSSGSAAMGSAALGPAALGSSAAAADQSGVAAPTADWTPQAAIYGTGALRDIPVTMSDGTVLRADVFFPVTEGTTTAAPGPFPVLLQQTPYGKEFIEYASAIANTNVDYLVDRGYIVVIADVRGTGDSGGDFDLFDPVQSTDGVTLAKWAARLPQSNGEVGLFGESYMGINQFQTVEAAGPNSPIKAMFPIIAGNDLYADTVTQGGIPDAEFAATYVALLSGLDLSNPALQPLVAALEDGDATTLTDGLENLPATVAQHSPQLVSFLKLILNVETGQGAGAFDDSYWQARSPAHDLASVVSDHIPAFLVGGWNDLFQAGEPLNYVGLQNLADGRSQYAAMTPGQKVTPRYQLLMGPWQHVTTGTGVNLSALELEWFDTWLLGEQTPLSTTPTPLHLEIENSSSSSSPNEWVDQAQWPLPDATPTAYYFAAGRNGSDPVSSNDGDLTTTAPATATGSDTITYAGVSSPCDIQTDQWGAGLLALGFQSINSSDPCDYDDVTLGYGPGALTYTTRPFAYPMVVAGPIDATVYTTSDTTNTELAATVEAVSPSGDSVPLSSGALLGSQRALDPTQTWTAWNKLPLLPVHPLTAASQKPVVPGTVTENDIQIFPTMAELPPGWSLRITLTTSETPHLLPSLTDLPSLAAGVYQVQRNQGAASVLNVPLAPASDFASSPCGSICSAEGP